VTPIASSVVQRVVAVRLFKGSLVGVVAAQAKRSLRLCQEILLVRAVGNMTGPASLG